MCTGAAAEECVYKSTQIAIDDYGGIWITDAGNKRILRFNYTTGKLIGRPVAFNTTFYNTAASEQNTSRVFSNYLEYSVVDHVVQPNEDASPQFPASESWVLRNNWAAGLDWLLRSGWPGYEGFSSIAEGGPHSDTFVIPGTRNRTFGLVNREDPAVSKAVVELVEGKGLAVMMVINVTRKDADGSAHYDANKDGYRSLALNSDGSLGYMVSGRDIDPKTGRPINDGSNHWTNQTQHFFRVPFDAQTSSWKMPGFLAGTIISREDELKMAEGTFAGNRFPMTSDGSLIIFDASKGCCGPGTSEPVSTRNPTIACALWIYYMV